MRLAMAGLCAVLIVSGSAPARQNDAPSGVDIEIRAQAEFGFAADLDDSAGDVAVHRLGSGVEAGFDAGERGRAAVWFGYDILQYDFADATGFVAGTDSPWETVHRQRIGARYTRQASDRWSWMAAGDVGASGEDGADWGDSLTGGGHAAALYKVSDRLTLGLGAAGRTRLEDSALVLPIVFVDWRFAEGWRLSNDGKPGVSLAYAPNDAWTFALGGWYEYTDFRLDDDGPAPDGVGREERVPVRLSATYAPGRRVRVGAELGVSAFHNLELDDADGDELGDSDVDPALFLGFRFSARF